MFNSLFNYVREVRQRRANRKTSGRSLNVSKMIDEAQEERRRLWENPPPCGSVIRYIPKYGYEETHGEFLFQATDVEQELQERLQLNPRLANGDDGSILRWVQGCDESVTEPTAVPSIWVRFQYVADDLIRAGKAEIYCQKCQATIGSDQISTNDDSGKRSWNFDRVVCPHGHDLLVVESLHLMMGKEFTVHLNRPPEDYCMCHSGPGVICRCSVPERKSLHPERFV